MKSTLFAVLVLLLAHSATVHCQSCSGSNVFCSLIFESNSPLCTAAGCTQPAPLFNCQGPSSKTCAEITRQDACEAVRCAWSGTTATTTALITPRPPSTPRPTVVSTSTTPAPGGVGKVTTTRSRTSESTTIAYDAVADSLGAWLGPVIWLSTCCVVFWCQMICKRRRSSSSLSSNPLYSSSSTLSNINQLHYSPEANQTQPAFVVSSSVTTPTEDADLRLLSDLHIGVLEAPDTAFSGNLRDDVALLAFSGKIADQTPPAQLATESPMTVPAFLAQWASQRSSQLLTNGIAFSAGAGLSDAGSFGRVQAQLLQQSVTTRRVIKLVFQILHEVEARSSGATSVNELASLVCLSLTKMPLSGMAVAQTVCEVLITRADDIDDGSGKSDFWKRPELPPATLEAGLAAQRSQATATAAAATDHSTSKDSESDYDSSEAEEERRRRETTD